MKQKLLHITTTVAILLGATLFVSPLAGASADTLIREGAGNTGQAAADSPNVEELFENVANILLFIVGAVAVIMIIISGVRYVVSQGDSGAVKSAKDTILYSVLGIVVAVFAYAIVIFVVDNVT